MSGSCKRIISIRNVSLVSLVSIIFSSVTLNYWFIYFYSFHMQVHCLFLFLFNLTQIHFLNLICSVHNLWIVVIRYLLWVSNSIRLLLVHLVLFIMLHCHCFVPLLRRGLRLLQLLWFRHYRRITLHSPVSWTLCWARALPILLLFLELHQNRFIHSLFSWNSQYVF